MSWTTVASMAAPVGGEFDFPSLSLAGFRMLHILGAGIKVTTDDSFVAMRYRVGGVEISANYRWRNITESTSGSANNTNQTADGAVALTSTTAGWKVGNAAAESLGFEAFIDAPGVAGISKKSFGQGCYTFPTGNAAHIRTAGLMDNTGAIDGIRIFGQTALTAGSVHILGLA